MCALLALAAGCGDVGHVARPAGPVPTIVFVHGLGGGPADWRPIANALARDHRVLLAALPGHAHEPMADTLPLEAAAARVRAAIRALPGPVVLVAHSAGGEVAVRVALSEPRRVAGLVLIETSLRPQATHAERGALRRGLALDYPGTISGVYRSFASCDTQGDDLARQALAVGPLAMRTWLHELLGDDMSVRAGALGVPVLLVLTDRSWPAGEPWTVTARALGYERIARATPLRFAGCGHFVMLDRPGELERDIRHWLGRSSPG